MKKKLGLVILLIIIGAICYIKFLKPIAPTSQTRTPEQNFFALLYIISEKYHIESWTFHPLNKLIVDKFFETVDKHNTIVLLSKNFVVAYSTNCKPKENLSYCRISDYIYLLSKVKLNCRELENDVKKLNIYIPINFSKFKKIKYVNYFDGCLSVHISEKIGSYNVFLVYVYCMNESKLNESIKLINENYSKFGYKLNEKYINLKKKLAELIFVSLKNF